MDKRLNKIKSYICNGVGIIDVGTDHGYLPIELLKEGYKGNIFASDINNDPLMTAVNNAKYYGYEDRIQFMLCDGLSNCNPSLIDTIVIAGMGGDLICNILDNAEWTLSSNYSIILQPMTKAEVLRFWLINNGYNIINDDIVSDGDKEYCVLNSRFDGINHIYSDAELYVGKNPTKSIVNKTIRMLEKKPKNIFYESILNELKGLL